MFFCLVFFPEFACYASQLALSIWLFGSLSLAAVCQILARFLLGSDERAWLNSFGATCSNYAKLCTQS